MSESKEPVATMEIAISQYVGLNELARSAIESLQAGHFPESVLQEINEQMTTAARLQASAISNWNSHSDIPSKSELKSELQKQIELLIQQTGEIEKRIKEQKDNLAPKIHQGVVARKMFRAYSNASPSTST